MFLSLNIVYIKYKQNQTNHFYTKQASRIYWGNRLP